MPIIKFTDTTGQVPEIYHPTPSKAHIPEWMQKLKSYHGGNFSIGPDGANNQTAKRCIPMLDAVMAGYTIVSNFDISVTEQGGAPYFQWPSGLGIDFHHSFQVATHSTAESKNAIPKFMSPWSIETPAGYSTLFVSPLNQDSPIVNAFAGFVDTDTYFAPVNFPFILKPGFSGVIEAGTPIAQAIPIRREAWTMKIESGNNKRIETVQNALFSKFHAVYRKQYWFRKEYN